MYATMDGYRMGWPVGPDNLLLVSVGTGSADPKVKQSNITVKHAVSALFSLMDDCAVFQETILQWLSASPTAREIDRELGDLRRDLLGGAPLITYLRYNLELHGASVQGLDPSLTDSTIQKLSEMDAPENMDVLHKLGKLKAEQDVIESDSASIFDLPAN